jgi:peptidyl-prolyl cis-trans isomerase C
LAFLRVAAIATALTASVSLHAEDDAERRARVAVRVGSRTVTVGELEDRLADLPPFQAERYGATRDEIVRAYVDQVVVHDLILGAGAEEAKLDVTFPTRSQLLRAKSTATFRALRQQVGALKSPASIPDADIAKYYEDNKSRYEGALRMNLWRILCKSRDEATAVIAEAKRDLTIPHYNELAREHSIDKATNLRGGNLGFLDAEGTSNEAGLKVDPALVRAAGSARDGELVGEPVAESGGFAVVWRRTTVPATHRSLADVAAQIRTTLYRERTEAAEKKLIDELRQKNLKNLDREPLKIIEMPVVDAGVMVPRSGAGSTPRSLSPGSGSVSAPSSQGPR